MVGCYPSRFKEDELREKFPLVDIWLTTKNEMELKTRLSELVFKHRFHPNTPHPYIKLTPSHFAYIKISEGCNNWCTFCTIPKIRGVHTSKTIDTIVEEAKKQLDFGVKELILIAEDTTCWGEDLYGKPSFPKLLDALADLPFTWIRPMYIYPTRVDKTLAQVISDRPNICNYIDMPIQHVNSDLLKGMKRNHDKDHLIKILDMFFETIPNLSLRTTFIAGFPGETEAHVDELLDFITRYPFSHIGCFTYSQEKNTRAYTYDNQVPDAVARERMDRIMEHQYQLIQKRSVERIGSRTPLLYEGHSVGRTYMEAPDVDSVIKVINPANLLPGTFYNATIIGHDKYDFIAEVTPGELS